MLTRRTTFRLYPTPQQEQKLFEWRRLHCYIYNAALADRRDMYKHWGISVNYYGQQNCLPDFKRDWPEFVEVGSQALQATVKRVDLAFQSFFKGLRGRPKFKSIRQYSGWTFPNKQSWRAQTDGKHGNLKITNLGVIRMRGQARTWGGPTTCTIVYRPAERKWYASFTVKCNPVRETDSGSVGLDLGCKEALTLSTGEKFSKPAFIGEGERLVKVLSKQKRRKRAPSRKKGIKASNRWNRAARKVAKAQRRVTNQRADWLHKLTSDIVSRNSLVCGEQLNVKGMTRKAKKGSKRKRQKAGLNRSILSVGFGVIGQMLGYKEAEAGGFYLESPTRQLKPTQRCAKCWELTPKTLADRVHICSSCGHTEDRDVNAAQVNHIWGVGYASSNVDGTALLDEPVNTGGFKQLSQAKRKKPLASFRLSKG